MERRATKHLARRDDVLVRAIMRIWKAHERGKLLTRVRALRVMKQAWLVWRRRMEEQRDNNVKVMDSMDVKEGQGMFSHNSNEALVS